MELSDIIAKDLKLYKKGNGRYSAKCPWHDDKDPSLTINDNKGIFKCFVCGVGGKGAAAYIMKSRSLSYKESLKLLNTKYPSLDLKNEGNKEEIAEVIYVPVTEDAQKPDFQHYIHGRPTNIYDYRNLNGDIIGYTARYNTEDGGKVVLPYNYIMVWDSPEWIFKGFKAPSLPYRAELIHKHPNATICIVEGEKAANIGNNSVNNKNFLFLAWCGGANAINYVDWSCLKGRKIILIPDHDKLAKDQDGNLKIKEERPGNKAMLGIASHIQRIALKIEFVIIPEEYPHKWDIADRKPNWRRGDLPYWINKHKQNYFKLNL